MSAHRVPDDVVRRLQDEETPSDCGPHCHQAARIDSLFEYLERRAEVDDERHKAILAALSDVRGSVRDLRVVVDRSLLASVESANATSRVAVVTAEQARRSAPVSTAPRSSRTVPKWVYGIAAGVGTTIGAVVAEYLARK